MSDTEVVHDDGVLTISRIPGSRGYVLAGEIDATTYGALLAALADIAGGGDVYLDLSGLDFCDAAGLNAMVGLVDRVGDGRRVVLEGVPGPLRKLLSVVGWESLPNLEVRPRVNGRPTEPRSA